LKIFGSNRCGTKVNDYLIKISLSFLIKELAIHGFLNKNLFPNSKHPHLPTLIKPSVAFGDSVLG